ncbi:cation diffusion facilitator family transporter [Streptomyces sp. NPDC058423]|uniref:cation diffusion facilitator family transporter n=1 Tax=unclassified Streptomyces TaxID=2593676 RepID=UPI00365571C7
MGTGHGPGHGHGGSHGHDHTHGVTGSSDKRWLSIALALIVGFMSVEVVIGVVAESLALISDAAHMLTDAVAIVLALVAMRIAKRPAKGSYTYGLKRVEILSAQVNGLSLILLGAWLTVEAVERLIDPPEVKGGLMLATALVGIAVNVAATWCISRANRSSLNVEGAYQHILNDLFAFIGTAVAAFVVLTTGFARADGIATLVVVALMFKAGYGLLRDSGRIFLEAAPAHVDPDRLGERLAAEPSVREVHDLHVWQITSEEVALSAHVLVESGGDCHAVRRGLEDLVRRDFGITHTTLQVDHRPEAVLQVGAPDGAPAAAAHCADPHGPVHGDRPYDHGTVRVLGP